MARFGCGPWLIDILATSAYVDVGMVLLLESVLRRVWLTWYG